MTLKIEIDFNEQLYKNGHGDWGAYVAKMLHSIAIHLEQNSVMPIEVGDTRKLMDINGNDAGTLNLEY